jgi:hypothetical protein
MALGKPVINIPRTTSPDGRALAAALSAANARILALEKIVNDLPNQTLSALNQALSKNQNGFVVKKGFDLVTRKIKAGSGVTIVNEDGQKGDTLISAP